MRFEQDTACRGTHCASTPLPTLQHLPEDKTSTKEPELHAGARRLQPLGDSVTSLICEGANTVLKVEAGGPGMAYPAPTAALNRHSPFSSSSSASAATANTNPNGHLPAPAAPRPTDFSVSSLLTAATHHPLSSSSASRSSVSPPAPASPSAAAPDTPPPPIQHRDLSAHQNSAVAAANYFNAAALAAAGFYPSPHLPPVTSPTAHHLQNKAILAGAHHHQVDFCRQGIPPQGNHSSPLSIIAYHSATGIVGCFLAHHDATVINTNDQSILLITFSRLCVQLFVTCFRFELRLVQKFMYFFKCNSIICIGALCCIKYMTTKLSILPVR